MSYAIVYGFDMGGLIQENVGKSYSKQVQISLPFTPQEWDSLSYPENRHNPFYAEELEKNSYTPKNPASFAEFKMEYNRRAEMWVSFDDAFSQERAKPLDIKKIFSERTMGVETPVLFFGKRNGFKIEPYYG